MAFSCTQEMPLTLAGTSSNIDDACAREPNGGRRVAAVDTPAAARRRRNSRRDGTIGQLYRALKVKFVC
jgi:hypothetical protein